MSSKWRAGVDNGMRNYTSRSGNGRAPSYKAMIARCEPNKNCVLLFSNYRAVADGHSKLKLRSCRADTRFPLMCCAFPQETDGHKVI
jgi:hypothetical protein